MKLNAIELRDVHLTYSYVVKGEGKKDGILNRMSKKYVENHVLNGLNLDVKKGEILGVIGSNGSGKSSLLSIIAKILEPDSGSVSVNGRVATILELGMGFHDDLTGRDNIILKGELYGFSKKQMELKMDNIIDYAGIRTYIDNPVRTYSSGMRSRLAFSIMVNVDADIMLVDEILSTGDEFFSAKASDFFKKIMTDGKTVVYVSHSPGSIESICTRAIWLKDGNIVADGKPRRVMATYRNAMMESLDVIMDQAKSGLAEAQYRLSQLYSKGLNVEKNYDLYRYWLESAAEQGHLKAQVEYADLLIKDEESNRDIAMMYYKSSAARGDNIARERLSSMVGNFNDRSKREEIRRIFEYMAQLGSPPDMYRYASFLIKTAWDDTDREKAFVWFKKVADEYNHPDAIIQLALMYRDGIGTKKDIDLFVKTLEKGESLDVVKAINMLAELYSSGMMVEEDLEKALYYYEKCANMGVVSCQYNVAMMYLEGKGTESDLEKAAYWFDVYSNSMLEPYQLNLINISKNHAVPDSYNIFSLIDGLHNSRDAKVLMEIYGWLSKNPSKDYSEKISAIMERLSKSTGKGMSMSYDYYSNPLSIGYCPSKSSSMLKKMIYTANPDYLFKYGIDIIDSLDSREKDIALNCIILAARLGNLGAVRYCISNTIEYAMVKGND